jgi:hypothetical protein
MISLAERVALALGSLLAASAAQAIVIATPVQATTPLTVASSIAATPGLLHFSYAITNTASWTVNGSSYSSPLVRFTVPYFADSGITNITAPVGWSYAIYAEDSFNLPGSKTLTWSGSVLVSGSPCNIPGNGNPNCIASAIQPGETGVGFGFDTPLPAAAKAPYRSDFYTQVTPYTFYDLGDPPIPASPQALAAGLQPLPVPEPATWALWLLGAAALTARRLRQRQG